MHSQCEPLDGAIELLEQLAGRYVVVSNNSTHTAQALARALRARGLPLSADRLVLAGEQTLRFMAQHHPGARIRLLGSPALRRHARALGCTLVDTAPDFVVLARHERFDYATLATAVNELRAGAHLVVTNPDLSHPAPHGTVVPETGALMRAMVECAGIAPALVIGKPEGGLFVEGLRRLGAKPADTLVIGDNPLTDAQGAARLGMRFLLLGASPAGPRPHASRAAAPALTNCRRRSSALLQRALLRRARRPRPARPASISARLVGSGTAVTGIVEIAPMASMSAPDELPPVVRWLGFASVRRT